MIPPISTEAATVNVSLAESDVGVPEIIPFVASKVKPAGNVPEMEYVAVDPTSAKRVVEIGVIATLSASILLAAESVIAGFVMKVAEVTAGPGPAAFDAVTEAMY